MTSELGYRLFDADNHYYETADCFTRHIEPRYREQAITPARNGEGDVVFQFEGRTLAYAAAEMVEEAEPPGSLMRILKDRSLRRREDARVAVAHDPAYVNRDARLALMDRQGIEAAVLLPTAGVTVEQALTHRPDALTANLVSFNRWLDEEWGYGTDGRIYGVPVLSLHDRDGAVRELERVLDRGARLVYLRPGHINGRSPADTWFDPFWARLDEANVPVVLHISAGALDQSVAWGEDPEPHHRAMSAFQFAFYFCDRPVMEMLGSLILHDLFGRFPNVKVLSIENGSAWLPYFKKVLYKGWRMTPFGPAPFGRPSRNPLEVFAEHVWVAPYPESDNAALVADLGAERVLFGSDYPHPEGTVEPVEFAASLEGVGPDDVRRVMRDNLRTLLAG